VNGAPATNNPIENYYSTSLKTHRKKQLREKGIKNQLKLSAMKRAGMLKKPEKTLLLFKVHPFHGSWIKSVFLLVYTAWER
jgi:hypothetical protein